MGLPMLGWPKRAAEEKQIEPLKNSMRRRQSRTLAYTCISSPDWRTKWQCSSLAFCSSVWISAGTLPTVTKDLHGFPQSLQANAGLVPQFSYAHFLPKPFSSSFMYPPTIWHYKVQLTAHKITPPLQNHWYIPTRTDWENKSTHIYELKSP
jgi:hypothetical protein